MKRIGLLGGMSWESTAEYYRLINETTRERLGGLHSATCVGGSFDFADIEELQRNDAREQAGGRLASEARGPVAAARCTEGMQTANQRSSP